MTRQAILLLTGALLALPIRAQTPVEISIDGNEAVAEIELVGGIEADLTLTFESVVGLTAANLGIDATTVLPTNPALLARLPQEPGISIPSAFPVLITVSPPLTGGLSMSGVVEVSLHTSSLDFTGGPLYRIFAAPDGGNFVDITDSVGAGSYRAGGRKGGFSDFLIVADLRSADAVIETKFTRLAALLESHELAMSATAYDALSALLDSALALYLAGDRTAAANQLEAFDAEIQARSGAEIPDVWRSSRDLVNVAGDLRSAATTLRFSLRLAP